MIKVICSIGAYHNDYVKKFVDDIQDKGYDVKEIKRISRSCIFFGEDVTHIIYEKDENKR